jgi:hypothetical protein
LRTVLEFLRAGDVLMVTRCPARSIGDLQHIVRQLKARGASLKTRPRPRRHHRKAGPSLRRGLSREHRSVAGGLMSATG